MLRHGCRISCRYSNLRARTDRTAALEPQVRHWQTLPAPHPRGRTRRQTERHRAWTARSVGVAGGVSTMNRSRLEPLGVPESDYGFDEAAASRHEPSGLDRWLVKQITSRLGTFARAHRALGRARRRAARRHRAHADPRPQGAVAARRQSGSALRRSLQLGPHASSRRSADAAARGLSLHGREHRDRRACSRAAASWRPTCRDSKRNIHHHYDIGNDFYKLWLDREALQYTCAYFADPAMTIEQAQQAKMHHVCRKLQLKPGERVVEAGGGWGGFALFMAKNYGVRVAQLQHLEGADRALARLGEAARARRPSRVRRGRLPQPHGHVRRVRVDRHARARRQGQLQGARRADEPGVDAARAAVSCTASAAIRRRR